MKRKDMVSILNSEGWNPIESGSRMFSRPCDQCGNDGEMRIYIGHKCRKTKTIVKCPRCDFVLDVEEK